MPPAAREPSGAPMALSPPATTWGRSMLPVLLAGVSEIGLVAGVTIGHNADYRAISTVRPVVEGSSGTKAALTVFSRFGHRRAG